MSGAVLENALFSCNTTSSRQVGLSKLLNRIVIVHELMSALWRPELPGRFQRVYDKVRLDYGLPLEILARSMAPAATDKAACLASSSDWYRLSEPPAIGILVPVSSSNSAFDVQSPSACCSVVMMIRCP